MGAGQLLRGWASAVNVFHNFLRVARVDEHDGLRQRKTRREGHAPADTNDDDEHCGGCEPPGPLANKGLQSIQVRCRSRHPPKQLCPGLDHQGSRAHSSTAQPWVRDQAGGAEQPMDRRLAPWRSAAGQGRAAGGLGSGQSQGKSGGQMGEIVEERGFHGGRAGERFNNSAVRGGEQQ